jgi:cell division septal protein FtsQ
MEVNRNGAGEAFPQTRHGEVTVIFFLVALVAGLLGIILINSGFFTIKSVVVQGNRVVAAETIILATRITRGQSMLTINRQRVAQAILRNPYIAQAKLFLRFPNQVVVKVVERHPVCLVVWGSSCYLTGNDCAVLGVATKADQANLPLVQGVRIKNLQIGERLNATALGTAMTILNNSDRKLRLGIRKLDLSQYRLYLAYPGNPNLVTVELGNANRLPEKMANLRAVLAENQACDLVKIDLRVPEISTVTTLTN